MTDGSKATPPRPFGSELDRLPVRALVTPRLRREARRRLLKQLLAEVSRADIARRARRRQWN